jgi:predicted methyltransferase
LIKSTRLRALVAVVLAVALAIVLWWAYQRGQGLSVAKSFSYLYTWSEDPEVARVNVGKTLCPMEVLASKTHELNRHEDVESVVAKLELEPGMVVADVGAGIGVFTRPLGRALGSTGTLYATELDPSLLAIVASRYGAPTGATGNLAPLKLVWASPDDMGLGPATVDLALLSHLDFLAFRATGGEQKFLQTVFESVRPGGRVAVLQWVNFKKERVTPPDQPTSSSEAIENIVRNVEQVGFKLAHVDRLRPRPGYLPEKSNFGQFTREQWFDTALVLFVKTPGE